MRIHLETRHRQWISRQVKAPDPLILKQITEASIEVTIDKAVRTVTRQPKRLSFGTRRPSKPTDVQLQVALTPGNEKVEDKVTWMRRIREINPTSTLVFTDGSGKGWGHDHRQGRGQLGGDRTHGKCVPWKESVGSE